MGNKIVIDANVPWYLDADKVNFLEMFLICIGDDELYISYENFIEIPLLIRNKLNDKINIVHDNEDEFDTFTKETRSLKLFLDNKDRHVLFLAQKLKADFVVSSDDNVRDKVDKYREHKKLNYMEPLSTISLLNYLHRRGRIQYITLLDKGLYMFKNKEIENALKHLNDNDLSISKISECKLNLKNKFELYRDPIVTQYKNLSHFRGGNI